MANRDKITCNINGVCLEKSALVIGILYSLTIGIFIGKKNTKQKVKRRKVGIFNLFPLVLLTIDSSSH